ncbi:MAG: diaminopimelate epimerase [Flavobacteriales bacterium]
MHLQFAKWHGTGNDFILIDDRDGAFPATGSDLVKKLCDRHLGIGSDGLILIQAPRSAGARFHMEFFNPDGSRSFCGNGSRCAFAFWSGLEGTREEADFSAIDGAHNARWVDGMVSVSLNFTGVVSRAFDGEQVDFVHNGSPHELVWVEDPGAVQVLAEGRERRHAQRHAPGGTNVNFVTVRDGAVHMRTYERGVEAETLSCGTGVVAAALSALERERLSSPVTVHTPGGRLQVRVERGADGPWGIRLVGPVKHVFSGSIDH